MNLQEFIQKALIEVVAGVSNAREGVVEYGAIIGSDKVYGHTSAQKIITDSYGRQLSTIEFDIALTESSTNDKKEGIGVFLGSVNLGSQGATHGETTAHSRIKFSVPVVFPGKGD